MRDENTRQAIVNAFVNMDYDPHPGSILAVMRICHQNLRYFGGTEWSDIANDIYELIQEERNQ